MFSSLIFVLILSVLIIVHEFGHFIAARRVGIRVEKFSLGFGPKLLNIKKGDTTYQICLVPLGGYIKMAGDSRDESSGKDYEYLSKKPKDRAKVVVSGAILNYFLGLVCFCLALFLGIPDGSPTVGEVVKGYPAETAGILAGDRIVSVDGKEINFWIEMVDIIQDKNGSNVNISLLRNNETLELDVPTKLENVYGPGDEEQQISLIGIKQGEKKYGLGQAFFVGTGDFLKTTLFYYKALGAIATGKVSFKRSVTGPIGIYYITSGAIKRGLGVLLYVVAMLNLSLAIVNLLPFPVLDGGHLALLAIEKIRGKRLKVKVEEFIERVGMSLIILLAVFVIYNDIINFGIWDNIVKWVSFLKIYGN